MDVKSALPQLIQINMNPWAVQADLAFYVELNRIDSDGRLYFSLSEQE